MKFVRNHIILAGSLVLFGAGCDDKARQLAKQTDDVLRQRSMELAAQTARETSAYQAYAARATEDQRTLVSASLANDRSEQADEIAAQYLEAPRTIVLWRARLAKYADLDYTKQKQQLTTDLDATSAYLTKLEDVSIQQDKVDALQKLLKALEKEPSLKDQISSITSFADDTKQVFDKDVCGSLKTKKAGTDAAAKTAYQLYTDKKCDDVLK